MTDRLPEQVADAACEPICAALPDGTHLRGLLYRATATTVHAPLCLCIHGLGVDARVWQFVAPRLCSRGFNVLCLDLRGHGLSDDGRWRGMQAPAMGHELLQAADTLSFLRAIGRRIGFRSHRRMQRRDHTRYAEHPDTHFPRFVAEAASISWLGYARLLAGMRTQDFFAPEDWGAIARWPVCMVGATDEGLWNNRELEIVQRKTGWPLYWLEMRDRLRKKLRTSLAARLDAAARTLGVAEPWLRARVRVSFAARRLGHRRHDLGRPLILSLTSYPPRFPTLHLTLMTLLRQRVRPDRTELWIYRDDLARLPQAVRRLERQGLTIRSTDRDLRSYTKLIPALIEHPDAYICTADDTYYPQGWLEGLTHSVVEGERCALCHRAHYIRVDADGNPRPYRRWEIETRRETADARVFLTGVGGVLYPPGFRSRGAERSRAPGARAAGGRSVVLLHAAPERLPLPPVFHSRPLTETEPWTRTAAPNWPRTPP